MTRYVIGLDPLLASTSIAAIANGVPTPTTKLIVSNPTSDKSVAGTHDRIGQTADQVIESVTRSGTPDFVMCMRPLTKGTQDDPSGPIRMMLVGEIQRRLIADGIPVAELAPMTLTKFVLGRFEAGEKSIKAQEIKLKDIFRGMSDPSVGRNQYRWTTVGLAAVAALTAGIETAMPVTDAGLTTLTKGKGLVLPAGWKLPATASDWSAKNTAVTAA